MKNPSLKLCQAWMKASPNDASVRRIQSILDLIAEKDVDGLNKALARYAYRPRIEMSRNGLSSRLGVHTKRYDGVMEAMTVHLLLFNAGLLEGRPVLIRECETCFKPFTCTLDRQRFCSNVCRQKDYDRKPENADRRQSNYQHRKAKPRRA